MYPDMMFPCIVLVFTAPATLAHHPSCTEAITIAVKVATAREQLVEPAPFVSASKQQALMLVNHHLHHTSILQT